MKKRLLTFSFCLLISSIFAQKTTEPKTNYRVEKEYDKDGNLIRYDSSRVERSPGLHKKFQFHFQTYTLSTAPSMFFFDNSNPLDSLMNRLKLDSLVFKNISPMKGKIIYLDSLIKKRLSPQFEDPYSGFDRGMYFFDFSDMKDQMKLFDSIINQRFKRFEELFDRLDALEEKQEKTKEKKVL